MGQVARITVVSIVALISFAPTRAEPPARRYVVIIESAELAPTKANGTLWDDPGPWEAPDPYVKVFRGGPAYQKEMRDLSRAISPLGKKLSTWKLLQSTEEQLARMPADAPGRARQEEIVRKLKGQGAAPLTAVEERRLKELERQQMELRKRNEYRTITVQDAYKANFNSGTLQVEAGDQIDIRVFDADPIVDDLAGKTELLLTREILEKGAVDLKFGQVRSLKLTFKPL